MMRIEIHSEKPYAVGALLVHGLNGGLHDMKELAEFLASHGIVAVNVLLPGHGTHLQDLLSHGWSEWTAALYKELQQLREQCEQVFLVGHSLGGALCLHMAASEPIAGIVTMCAPVYMYPWMLPAVRLVKRLTPVLPTWREDVSNSEARRNYQRDSNRWTPMAPVESMLQYLPSLRTELPAVKAPALIMIAIHDHVVPARDGQAIYRMLGSQEKYLVKFRRSYHVLMKDHDQEEVFARTLDFIESHSHKYYIR